MFELEKVAPQGSLGNLGSLGIFLNVWGIFWNFSPNIKVKSRDC